MKKLTINYPFQNNYNKFTLKMHLSLNTRKFSSIKKLNHDVNDIDKIFTTQKRGSLKRLHNYSTCYSTQIKEDNKGY